jgi:hypothetical protein
MSCKTFLAVTNCLYLLSTYCVPGSMLRKLYVLSPNTAEQNELLSPYFTDVETESQKGQIQGHMACVRARM